jgi:superfamily I DNA/RNA helicase
MILCPKTTIYIGPPGCGKTTALLAQVRKVLESGVPPASVGYVSFTRQALKEAVGRLTKDGEYSKNDLRHFRTVHSMAFYLLGARISDMVSDKQVEDSTGFAHLYHYHRVTGLPLTETWELHFSPTTQGTEEDFLRWVQGYIAHKKATKQLDFTDLLDTVATQKPYLPFTWLFVDEAQDLTPSQWAVVRSLAENADNLVVAGDPDQSIFTWAGADGSMLENLTGERIILNQSYRVPKKVHTVATRMLHAMGRDILYKPTPEQGTLHWCVPEEVHQLDYRNGETWYILCRNTYFLKDISKTLYQQGIWHTWLGEDKQNNLNMRLYVRLIDTYINWEPSDRHSNTAMEKRFIEASSDILGAKRKGLPWWEAFDLWPVETTAYLQASINDWDTRRVQLGTFHASKGGEADNVVLLGDTTASISEKLHQRLLSEMRALYVAVTRTKKNLYLVERNRRSGVAWDSYINLSQDLTNGLL